MHHAYSTCTYNSIPTIMTMHENLPILHYINFFTTVHYICNMLLHESIYYVCVSDMYEFVHVFVNKVCIMIIVIIMCRGYIQSA